MTGQGEKSLTVTTAGIYSCSTENSQPCGVSGMTERLIIIITRSQQNLVFTTLDLHYDVQVQYGQKSFFFLSINTVLKRPYHLAHAEQSDSGIDLVKVTVGLIKGKLTVHFKCTNKLGEYARKIKNMNFCLHMIG